jgi:hypothetical protein
MRKHSDTNRCSERNARAVEAMAAREAVVSCVLFRPGKSELIKKPNHQNPTPSLEAEFRVP